MNTERPTIKVIFPRTGKVIETVKVKPSQIVNGGRYLVDSDYNAKVCLELVNKEEPFPPGEWELLK